MKVYLVVDINNSPGKVLAVFADEEDAWDFIAASGLEDDAGVGERTLFYGQPPNPGYNE